MISISFFIFTPMKKNSYLFVLNLFLISTSLNAQSAKELQETAKSFIQQADYANALLVLNRAVQLAPKDLDILKDLSLTYYLQKDFTKSLEIIKPVTERDDADDQSFQLAGNAYLQLEQFKECEKLFRKGIKKFPESGAMYNELGELLMAQKDYSAIKYWEKGIEVDASFSKNYYNASKYYFLTTDKIWTLLYGEIFINIEPQSSRTVEIKNMLLDGYKKLFAEAIITLPTSDKNNFTDAFITSINKQSAVVAAGINVESLIMIRTRFILDWYQNYADKLPFKLFELHRQLLQGGMFEAYNQWIFGSSQNLAAYQNWTAVHTVEYNEFTRFQQSRLFKIPAGQYYR